MIVIHKYLVIAIQYDYPFTMVKYCIFRPGEKEDIMIVIHKYLVIAIQYDYPFTMVKYCVQQLLGSLQDTAMGNSSFLWFSFSEISECCSF